VVAALEIDVRLIADPWLDDDVEPLAFAGRRNCSWSAIFEQLLDLVFADQGEGLAEFRLELCPIDPARRLHHREHISVSGAHDDALARRSGGTRQAWPVETDASVGGWGRTS
jgi:hypothetical protein